MKHEQAAPWGLPVVSLADYLLWSPQRKHQLLGAVTGHITPPCCGRTISAGQ